MSINLNLGIYFQVFFSHKKAVHINHRPRSREPERICKQHWKIKENMQQNLQGMSQRGITKLKKVEPKDQG
jgi:hypothetical protein